MAQPYKLKGEIEQFIQEKKKLEPKFSCRSMVSLIKERFGLDLSKSTINTIIKENNLSGKAGRPRIREKIALQPLPVEAVPAPGIPKSEEIVPPSALVKSKTIEIRAITEQIADIEDGGAIFLLMADYKSGLTDFLAQKILPYMPDLSPDIIRLLIQYRVYGQIIKGEADLGQFLGKEPVGEYLAFYYEQLTKMPLNQLSADFISLGIEHKTNEINDLYKGCFLRLNSQALELFFPSVYKFLDFPAMCERFYSLLARIERKDTVITVGFLYPENFKAIYDIVWQEDFKSAISKLNKERIFSPEGKLFRFEEVLTGY